MQKLISFFLYLPFLLLVHCGPMDFLSEKENNVVEKIESSYDTELKSDMSSFVCSDTNRLDPSKTLYSGPKVIAYWDCKLGIYCRPQGYYCLPVPIPDTGSIYYTKKDCKGTSTYYPESFVVPTTHEDYRAWLVKTWTSADDILGFWYGTTNPMPLEEGSYRDRKSVCINFEKGTVRFLYRRFAVGTLPFLKTEDFYLIP